MPYQKVTFLEDLPDVDEVENKGMQNPQHHVPSQAQLSRRFIRNTATMHPESGMTQKNMEPIYVEEPISESVNFRNSPIIEMPIVQPQAQPIIQPQPPNCQEIFYHIDSCPLCKKFYKQDNTLYLVVILILVLVCALLMKKVLFDS